MIQQNLIKAVVGLVVFMVAMAVLGLVYEEEIVAITTWIVDRVGFLGLALILFFTDGFVTPFPPDLMLVIVANSPLSTNWLFYVTILGFVSVCAGMFGYVVGRWLGHFRWAQRLFGHFKEDHQAFIRKFGFWAIVLGSVTPLPYSVTCWSAGALGVRWTVVLSASLMFRIPRFLVFYWLLATSGGLFA